MIDRNPISVKHAKEERERFEAKYEKRGGVSCWPWTAGTFGTGYGCFYFDEHHHHAHRIAWALAYGEDPLFRLVLHDCDNRRCVRPEHLYLGSQQDNMDDVKFRSGPDAFVTNAKLTVGEVREIRERYELEDVTMADLGEEYGVSRGTICKVVNEVLWSYA